ncbi:MAG TPA: 50S ribosomal protein L11 methyltransferase [Puia sp.]|jgi:ribosomal protein L11 methyltransferase|nr:50S ribosomal protein L11 methyltransferase [Puia sp.]
METYIKITIALKNNSLSDILVAQLDACGFLGFEQTDSYLLAYVQAKGFPVAEFKKIIADNGVGYSKKIMAPKNWNHQWEKNFEPVQVEDFCGIRAPFHPPFKGVMHDVIITPKMSFGTGHHATTFLMIQAISNLECKEKIILDFGTGTGLLAIVAEKCGAKKIIAIDNDDWSIKNAAENIKANDCSKITVLKGETIEEKCRFDIIFANINLSVILRHFHSFKQHLCVQGVVVISGILSGDYEEIEKEARCNGLRIISKQEKENWICIVLNSSEEALLKS